MTTTSQPTKASRTRASERALTVALTAAMKAGLTVNKMLINGGKVEILFGDVEPEAPQENHEGLKEW